MRPISRSHLTFVLALLVTLAFASSASAATTIKFTSGSYAGDIAASSPTRLVPSGGELLEYPDASLEFSWAAVPGTTKYELEIARQNSDEVNCNSTSAFQPDNIVVNPTSTSNTWTPTMTDEASGEQIWTGTYCWRVRATGKSAGKWSTGARFTRIWDSDPSGLRFYNDYAGSIPRAGNEADIVNGSGSTRNTGYLTWDAVPGASTYVLQVGTSQSFSPSSITATREGIRDNKALLVHLPDDTYFWRVRAVAPNGTEGDWSAGSNSFTVQWLDASWSSPSNLYPAPAAVTTEMRVGWTPMPGASYYEYQIGTSAGCVWNSSNANAVPDAYGDWVNTPTTYDEFDVINFQEQPDPGHCRLSKNGATTMNNWVTLPDAWDPAVLANIDKSCFDGSLAPRPVLCVDAGIPTSTNAATDHRTIWWRVRPVQRLKPATETGWKINGERLVYGDWSSTTSFQINASAGFTGTGSRCVGGTNPTVNQCVTNVGSTMQVGIAAGQASANSMQLPVFVWEPLDTLVSGYIVQLARDPLFNNREGLDDIYVPVLKSAERYGFQHSYAMTEGLPDNSEGTGYWWRVVPCRTNGATNCLPVYDGALAGRPVSQGGAYSDAAVAQTFVKRTTMQTQIVPKFEGASPLVRWTTAGVGANDHAGWARGVEGAEYYEFELSRSPFFNGSGDITLKTTMPRIVPFKPGSAAGDTEELADGIWYYRVHAVDRNGLKGADSETGSFNKRIAAPTQGVAGGGGAGGAGLSLTWSAVPGAAEYTVQWSTSSTFAGTPGEATTRQTAYFAPGVKAGKYYWRVRALVNGITGAWSPGNSPVTVSSATRIDYALSRSVVDAKSTVKIYGRLFVGGKASNGKRLVMQKKSTGCNATGVYRAVATATTGARADDGIVSFARTMSANGCYRFAYKSGSVTYYSAPITVKVKPVTSYRVLDTKVARGSAFCARITTNVPVSGRLRVQYQVGRTWTTARSVNVRNMRSRQQCASIARAGVFPTRIVLDSMNVGSGTSRREQYSATTVTGATVRVNDTFVRL